ncbi:MAG: rRNA pseudouridine synthase [Clostridia bacterium]|nr:rRNA pseudouridine synthase [Clostridia bacterium]
MGEQKRIDRFLSEAGYTRSEAREMIASGRVLVNGRPALKAGEKTDGSMVEVDGRRIEKPGPVHIMLYKPAGVVTATFDAREKTVLSLLPEEYGKMELGPVGRLDKDVTGLVLLTTDGLLAHRLISPKWKAEKTYLAECEGSLSEEEADRMRSGIELSDFTARPAEVIIEDKSNICSIVRITVREGKYHQIKRMFAAVGHPILRLHRLSIGGLELDPALHEGEWRRLTREETETLYRRTGLS